MVDGFSSIIIATPDLKAAVEEYRRLLGAIQIRGASAVQALANVTIELFEQPGIGAPGIAGVTLWCKTPVTLPAARRGLVLEQSAERQTATVLTTTGIQSVDHIVLRTADADDCNRLFGNDLGMRLALDQSVPEWGGRMLFFRCGKLTLEVIQSDNPPAEDAFWGITYYCPDLAATLAALDVAGVAHSGERMGRKPGTRVATIKSHALGRGAQRRRDRRGKICGTVGLKHAPRLRIVDRGKGFVGLHLRVIG